MKDEMSPMERTFAALSHKEPDRVPALLLLTMHGAKLLDMPLKNYLTSTEQRIRAQLVMRDIVGHDCLYGFGYAAAETEAFGGEVIFFEDGAPNAGRPIVQQTDDIKGLEVPDIDSTICLKRTLDVIEGLKEGSDGEVPIIGDVMSPFSLPVMQMGFSGYLDLMHHDQEHFWQLMDINKRFCKDWANRQLEAGATAIVYFDPVSSTTIIPREMYLKTGHRVAKETIPGIRGPVVTHFASGRCLPILDDVLTTGTVGVGVSSLEDIATVKKRIGGRAGIVGNLNGIEMIRWGHRETEQKVRTVISAAGNGGGLLLSDNHGEIPYQVPWNVIRWVMDAVKKYGAYPLKE